MDTTVKDTSDSSSVLIKVSRKLFGPVLSYRRPTDIIYLILGLLLLIIATLLILGQRGVFENLDVNLFRLIYRMPSVIGDALLIVMQLGSLVAIPVLGILAALVGKHIMARNLALAGTLTWFMSKLLRLLLSRETPSSLIDDVIVRSGTDLGLGFPSGHVSVAAAMATVATPYLSRRLRWAVWSLVGLVALGRIYAGIHFPLDVISGFALGLVVGSLVNLWLGVPEEYLPRQAIREAFQDYDIELVHIEPLSEDAQGSIPYLARAEDGSEYFVKVVGTEHRNADFLFRVWRSILLKHTGSYTPFLTPQHQIEHEAFLNLRARNNGAHIPDIEFTTQAPGGFALLAQKRLKGRPLSQLEADKVDHEMLHEIWRQVKVLQEINIVHRDLRLANIFIDDQGQPWLIDFGFSAAGVDDTALGLDVAQMLASLTHLVGQERALNSALDVLGEARVAQALPALEPMTLSSETRAALESDKALKELQNAIKERTDAEIPEEESLVRLQPKMILWVIGLGIGVYLLFPQFSELGDIINAWRQAHLGWLALALAVATLSYVMAALQQQGATRHALPWGHNTLAHFAATFANRLGPRGVGGLVVLENFLEETGLERSEAITALTLKTAASALVHGIGLLLVIFFLGIARLEDIPLLQDLYNNWEIVVAVVLGIAFLLAVLWRPLDLGKYYDKAKQALQEVRQTMQEPLRAAALFGGALGVTLTYGLALGLSLWAIGATVSLVTVVAVYLAGEIIGSASPTPGGLGVLEGALVAGLTTFGVSTTQAVAGVLLYRLVTFWLPILPGLAAFRYMQNRDYL